MSETNVIDPQLLELLRCPETRQTLSLAEVELVERLNQLIAAGTLTNQAGETVDEPIDGALVREDGAVAYVIRDTIADMLIDHAIVLAKLPE